MFYSAALKCEISAYFNPEHIFPDIHYNSCGYHSLHFHRERKQNAHAYPEYPEHKPVCTAEPSVTDGTDSVPELHGLFLRPFSYYLFFS